MPDRKLPAPAALISLILGLVLAFAPGEVHAQDEEPPLRLQLIRTFGYGGFGQIQGRFSMRVAPVDGLERVLFLLDNEVVFEDGEAPFEFRFHTDNFDPGVHSLTALGYTAGGEELRANAHTREFLSSEAAGSAVSRFIVPLIVGVGVLALVSALLPLILGGRTAHRPGQYGLAGGAVCPRCAKPFSRHVLAPNLLVGKLERCPHCKKWSLVRRATPAELEAAEAFLAEDSLGQPPVVEDEEEKLRRMIDDSRYE